MHFATPRRSDPILFFTGPPPRLVAAILAAVVLVSGPLPGRGFSWLAFSVVLGLVVTGLLGYNTRVYAGKLQDRIIRVEQMLRFQRRFTNRIE